MDAHTVVTFNVDQTRCSRNRRLAASAQAAVCSPQGVRARPHRPLIDCHGLAHEGTPSCAVPGRPIPPALLPAGDMLVGGSAEPSGLREKAPPPPIGGRALPTAAGGECSWLPIGAGAAALACGPTAAAAHCSAVASCSWSWAISSWWSRCAREAKRGGASARGRGAAAGGCQRRCGARHAGGLATPKRSRGSGSGSGEGAAGGAANSAAHSPARAAASAPPPPAPPALPPCAWPTLPRAGVYAAAAPPSRPRRPPPPWPRTRPSVAR